MASDFSVAGPRPKLTTHAAEGRVLRLRGRSFLRCAFAYCLLAGSCRVPNIFKFKEILSMRLGAVRFREL